MTPTRSRCVGFTQWLWAIALVGTIAAAAEQPDPTSARFRRFDSSQGLSQDTVLAMAQDQQGWIWFGTQDGLNRFDGYDVTTYRAGADESDALHSNWISALLVDHQERLWIGTHAGVYRYQPEHDGFERIPLTEQPDRPGHQPFVFALHIDRSNRVWIGTDSGVSMYAPGADTATALPSWQPKAGADGKRRNVRALASDASGIWVGSLAGLLHFDPDSGSFTAAPAELALGESPINALQVDRHGQLWIATDRAGLIRFNPANGDVWRFDSASQPQPGQDRTHSLFETQDGSLWLGAEDGAYRLLDLNQAEPRVQAYRHRPHDPQSLGTGRIVSFLHDRDDTMWIGTWEGGASRLNRRYHRFLSFNSESEGTQNLSDSRILALHAEGERLWLGGAGGAYRFDTDRRELQILPEAANLTVFSFAMSDQHLWLGTGDGLYRRHRSTHDWQHVDAVPELAGARVRRLLLDEDRLWLFAELYGLYVLQLPDLQVIASHQFPGNAYNLGVLDDSTVWVGASDGLHWFSRDGLERRHRVAAQVDSSEGLPAPPTAVLDAGPQRHWIGTYGAGLFEMTADATTDTEAVHFAPLTVGRGLRNEGINGMLRDRSGRLWLATDRGMSRYSEDEPRVRNFDGADGALARGYYFSASAELSNGLLAFGSKHGFTVFDPNIDDSLRAPAAPLITQVEHDGQPLRPARRQSGSPLPAPAYRLERLALPPGWGRSLAFRFASAEFVAAEKLNYYYRLDGFNQQWMSVGSDRRLAGYTNLEPGLYTLRLVAQNELGQRSPETQLHVEIAPYWWQTSIARVTAMLLIFAFALLLYRLRMHQLRSQRAVLEQLIQERTRDLSDAKGRAETALAQLQSTQHELVRAEKLSALGQLVAGVAHEVNTPLGVAVTASSHLESAVRELDSRLAAGLLGRGDLQRFIALAQEGSSMIQRNLERAAELIRNFKQVSVDRDSGDRRRFNLQRMLTELTQSLRLLWKHRAIELTINCPSDIELDSFPGALGQVLTNLTQNALQHAFADAPKGTMKIEVHPVGPHRIVLSFHDDGAGIAAEHLPRVFEPFFTTRRHQGGTGLGMHIIHTLVTAQLGGSIQVDSTPGQGTTIELQLPRRAPSSESTEPRVTATA